MDPREPNIDRLLAAMRGGRGDRCPNFEVLMDHEPVRYVMDWPEPRCKWFYLTPAEVVERAVFGQLARWRLLPRVTHSC